MTYRWLFLHVLIMSFFCVPMTLYPRISFDSTDLIFLFFAFSYDFKESFLITNGRHSDSAGYSYSFHLLSSMIKIN